MATRLKNLLRGSIAALRGVGSGITRYAHEPILKLRFCFFAYPQGMRLRRKLKVSLHRNSLRSLSRSLRLALKPLATVLQSLGRGWRIIRRLSGDDGYELYLAYHAADHPDTPALPRREWFAHQQRQKWSGIKRCC